jgi:cytochrome c556
MCYPGGYVLPRLISCYGMRILLPFALVVVLLVSPAVAQAPTFKPYASLADLMAGVLFPNSNTIFDATKTPPKNDMEWTAIQTSAAVLAEMGNAILEKGRLKENGQPVPQSADFRKHVAALVQAAKGAHKAALSKNEEAVFNACEPLYQACYSCHQAYRFCPTCQEAAPPEAH